MQSVAAWTEVGPTHPQFLNISVDQGDVVVTVRAPSTKRQGEHVCGYASDGYKYGGCVPGGPTCNNYCNAAPQKGPMQDAPLPFEYVDCGDTSVMRMPLADWRKLQHYLVGTLGVA